MSKPKEEKEQDARIEKYHALVERQFGGTLTTPEEAEMELLGLEIDRYFEPFYRPIIARLEAELREKREARLAAQVGERLGVFTREEQP